MKECVGDSGLGGFSITILLRTTLPHGNLVILVDFNSVDILSMVICRPILLNKLLTLSISNTKNGFVVLNVK